MPRRISPRRLTYTLRNLEITRNLRDGGKKNTLLDVLDFTETAMGSRLLKKWLEYPLLSIAGITQRLDAVEELVRDFSLRGGVRDGCREIHDFERLLTRIEVGTANARDLVKTKVSALSARNPREAEGGKVFDAQAGRGEGGDLR